MKATDWINKIETAIDFRDESESYQKQVRDYIDELESIGLETLTKQQQIKLNDLMERYDNVMSFGIEESDN